MRPIDADLVLQTHELERSAMGKDWTIDDLVTEIELAPTLDVVPVIHGCWETVAALSGKFNITSCSICRESLFGRKTRYCSNCGAKMLNPEEDV